ncbi:NUDIX hydrolase [Micromonospora mangrovi]|uniref:NUDIX hydrolase n=2 Tax=Micromonospora TaxID=1873 RepID=A0AAU8HEJ9_9ACTN
MSGLTWAVAAVVTDDTGRVLLCRRELGGRWALPGGRLHRAECPSVAVVREIRAETGWDVELIDLVGLYRLTRAGSGPAGRPHPVPDVLVHVFRARAHHGRPTAEPAGGCRLRWHPPTESPDPVTPITAAALADARAGRSGVLRHTPDPVPAHSSPLPDPALPPPPPPPPSALPSAPAPAPACSNLLRQAPPEPGPTPRRGRPTFIADAAERAPAHQDPAGTESAGTNSAGTDSAHTDSAGTKSAGTNSARTDSAGTKSAGTNSAGPKSAGPTESTPPTQRTDRGGAQTGHSR